MLDDGGVIIQRPRAVTFSQPPQLHPLLYFSQIEVHWQYEMCGIAVRVDSTVSVFFRREGGLCFASEWGLCSVVHRRIRFVSQRNRRGTSMPIGTCL